MKRIATLAVCASLASLLAACSGSTEGYYDAHGNFVPTTTPHNMEVKRAPMPGGNPNYREDRAEMTGDYGRYDRDDPRRYDYRYDDRRYDDRFYPRRGYYDYQGAYVRSSDKLSVPAYMYPPRGMCRVWFPERLNSNQPDIESCDGIRYRVPEGAYVIYGG